MVWDGLSLGRSLLEPAQSLRGQPARVRRLVPEIGEVLLHVRLAGALARRDDEQESKQHFGSFAAHGSPDSSGLRAPWSRERDKAFAAPKEIVGGRALPRQARNGCIGSE